MLDLEKFVFDEEMDPIRTAIMLSMTQNQDVEKEMLQRFRAMGVRCAVTMISGRDFDTRSKVMRNVIGLCLNEGLVEKKKAHIHPVVHTIWEATQTSRIMDAVVAQSLCIKVAAVVRGNEFALSFYGNMGMHECSAHKTIGIGMQILGE